MAASGRRDRGREVASGVRIRRAYDPPEPSDGWRVLVDRVWPRGLTREDLRLDERRADLAPSTELRRWFGHDPTRWDEFRRRYREELRAPAASAGLEELAARARAGRVTLVYSARDEEHNQARVLEELIRERLGDRGGGTNGGGESGAGGGARTARDGGGGLGGERADPGAGDDVGAGGGRGDDVGAGTITAAGAPDASLVAAVDRLIRAGVAVTTRALAELPAVDVTLQQWRVLVLLAESGGLRIGVLAGRVGQSVPSASRIVGRLEDRGLVRSSRDPLDRRATVVRATGRGRRIVEAVVGRRRRLIEAAMTPGATAPGATAPGEMTSATGTAQVVETIARALDHLA